MTFITGGQRAQTSHGIIVSEIQILDKKVYILIISVMEQTKAKKHMNLCHSWHMTKNQNCVQ